jgi:hypothetical protein
MIGRLLGMLGGGGGSSRDSGGGSLLAKAGSLLGGFLGRGK